MSRKDDRAEDEKRLAIVDWWNAGHGSGPIGRELGMLSNAVRTVIQRVRDDDPETVSACYRRPNDPVS